VLFKDCVSPASLLFASLFFLMGCEDTGRRRGNFTVTGRLLRDCSNTPLDNAPVSIHFNENPSIGGRRSYLGVVGSGTTAGDGSFSIECAYYGNDGAVTVESDSLSISSAAGFSNRRVDFGTLYRQVAYSGHVRVSVNVPYTPSDTLFISNNAGYSLVTAVHPIAPIQTVPYTQIIRWSSLQDAARNPDSIRAATFWGIGRAQFDSAISAQLAPAHFWQVNLRRCSQPVDITDVVAR
jgi:hypothetical protein